MMALAYLVAAGLYLTLMFFVVRGAWRSGLANGGSKTKAFGLATAAFLVVYLLVFWNWIPVVLTHRSLCNKDAGFTVYVTPEEWVAQNKSSLNSVAGVDLSKMILPREYMDSGFSRYRFFGGLLTTEEQTKTWSAWGINFYRGESRVLDTKTNSILTRSISYTAGNREDIRLWLHQPTCFDSDVTQPSTLTISFINKLKEQIK